MARVPPTLRQAVIAAAQGQWACCLSPEWYGKDGAQNYAKWSNHDFQVVVKQIDRETDTAQRRALVCHAEDILEQDPPLLPVAWEKIYDG